MREVVGVRWFQDVFVCGACGYFFVKPQVPRLGEETCPECRSDMRKQNKFAVPLGPVIVVHEELA